MATYSTQTIVTNIGRSMAHIAFESGFKITPRTFRIGNGAPHGGVGLPDRALIELNNPIWPPDHRDPITGYQWIADTEGNNTIIEFMIYLPPTDPGTGGALEITLSEAGIYLDDGTLFAVGYVPLFQKLANEAVVLRLQVQLANDNSLFEFSGLINLTDSATAAFEWVFVAGITDQKIKGQLHTEIHQNVTSLETLRQDLSLLRAAWEFEHFPNGYHRNGVGARGDAVVNRIWDELAPLTTVAVGDVITQTLYVNPAITGEVQDGSYAHPFVTLMGALAVIRDLPDTEVVINLFSPASSTAVYSIPKQLVIHNLRQLTLQSYAAGPVIGSAAHCTVILDFEATALGPVTGAGIVAVGPDILIRQVKLYAPWKTRLTATVTAPAIMVSGGSRVEILDAQALASSQADDTYSDDPTHAEFSPILLAGPGGALWVHGSSIIDATGGSKQGLGLQARQGGVIRADGITFNNCFCCIDNALRDEYAGGVIAVSDLSFTGTCSAPRILFDQYLTVRNIGSDGTSPPAAPLYPTEA